MSQNMALPPDLAARILAECALGVRYTDLVLRLSPRGSTHDHLAILDQVRLLQQRGALVRDGELLIARADVFAGGVAA